MWPQSPGLGLCSQTPPVPQSRSDGQLRVGGTTLGGPGSVGEGSAGSGSGPEPPPAWLPASRWDEETFSPPSSSPLAASRGVPGTLSPGEGSPAGAEAVGEGAVSSRLRFRRPKGVFRLSCVVAVMCLLWSRCVRISAGDPWAFRVEEINSNMQILVKYYFCCEYGQDVVKVGPACPGFSRELLESKCIFIDL